MQKSSTHSEASKNNFTHFRSKSSCEREGFFNWAAKSDCIRIGLTQRKKGLYITYILKAAVDARKHTQMIDTNNIQAYGSSHITHTNTVLAIYQIMLGWKTSKYQLS